MPKESLEDMVRRVFTEESQKREQAEKEEKDPKAWLSGEIRRAVNEALDTRLNEGRPKSSSREERDDDDQGEGFFAKIIGGGS